MDVGGSHFNGGHPGDLAHQVGVPGRPQADVMREDHGALQVAVAVDGVDAVNDRNPKAGFEGGGLVGIHHIGPSGRGVLTRRAPASAQNPAN